MLSAGVACAGANGTDETGGVCDDANGTVETGGAGDADDANGTNEIGGWGDANGIDEDGGAETDSALSPSQSLSASKFPYSISNKRRLYGFGL